MKSFPLNLCIFTSTGGHFNFYDCYQTSINHLEKKLGSLDIFRNKIAHIKVRPRPEEQKRCLEMVEYFNSKNIQTIRTDGEWGRGMSHQNEYLKDIRKVFNSQLVQSADYTLWFEDDSPIEVLDGKDLANYFYAAIEKLKNNYEVLTVRFPREGLIKTESEETFLASDTFDFQPNICRSRDLLVGNRIIENNWNSFSQIQCEMAFRLAIQWMSNSTNKFLVFNPKKAFSYHIGTPEYQKYIDILK